MSACHYSYAIVQWLSTRISVDKISIHNWGIFNYFWAEKNISAHVIASSKCSYFVCNLFGAQHSITIAWKIYSFAKVSWVLDVYFTILYKTVTYWKKNYLIYALVNCYWFHNFVCYLCILLKRESLDTKLKHRKNATK